MAHALAGKPVPKDQIIDLVALERDFQTKVPDPDSAAERVAFGTSGHRGTSTNSTFTAAHIRAITQAIIEHRIREGITGPLFVGHDTHALSKSAERVALEVLASSGVVCRTSLGDIPTPTPAVSHAILEWNRSHPAALADGVVITPSHNPPEDGGFKYNPPNGGPADTYVTKGIEARANELLRDLKDIGIGDPAAARRSGVFQEHDYISEYVDGLKRVVNIDAIAQSGLRIGADPLGGSSLRFMEAIADRLKVPLEITNRSEDPTFSFMPLDHDGKIRMDCSSPFAMANLLSLQSKYDLAVAQDPDADRHGIVSPSAGLLNPNHFLALSISYLFRNRPQWLATGTPAMGTPRIGVGKTLVSSDLINRIVQDLGLPLFEVPVGFKWFVKGLSDGSLGFGGEESAGASFLCFDRSPWSTDKDGIILSLLAAEMTAVTGKEPGLLLSEIKEKHGIPAYRRIDRPISPEQKLAFQQLSAERFSGGNLGGAPITEVLTRAPGNNESIGGVKVISSKAWFAARPSGTENIYKLYAESLDGDEAQLNVVLTEAEQLLSSSLK